MKSSKSHKIIYSSILTLFVIAACTYFISKIKHSDSSGYSADDKNGLNKLSSLGYITWTTVEGEDSEKAGVTIFNPKKACVGQNLFYSENKKGAYIFNMKGDVTHEFTDKRIFRKYKNWQFVEPCGDGDFWVIIQTKEIFKIDWNSSIKKRITGPFHHDITIVDEDTIYTYMHEVVDFPDFCTDEPIRNDWLVSITNKGEIKKLASFAKMVRGNPILYDVIKKTKDREYAFGKDAWDIFHTNSIEFITRDVFNNAGILFKKGNVLSCIRHLNAIVVIDVESEKIIWQWGMDEIEYPHHASLLDNGNILLFDNGIKRKYSRVVELNPVSKQIEWEYKGDPPESFYSATRGSAERLPNGNTLIAETHKGRVFEVTPVGEVVWEFYNPEMQTVKNKKTGKEKIKRANIYRMHRIFDLKISP